MAAPSGSRRLSADIAAEAGLTAGALVQRFGSKRGLLLAFAARTAAGTPDYFARLRTAHRSPLAALRAYADCFGQMGESPGALARGFAYLQLDLTDPDFRRHTLAQARATRAGLRDLLEAAVAAGELGAHRGHQRPRARRGSHLDALLRPFLASSGRKGRSLRI